MKPIDEINKCLHCERCPVGFICEFQELGIPTDTPCSIQDYMICPLKSKDDRPTGKEGC